MATATIETRIANPAKKKGGKMTAKQIKFFGSKAQKAALKRKRKNAAKKSHRARTKPAVHRKKKRVTNPASAPKKSRKRPSGAKKRNKARRKNPGAIYALVNPAGKKGQKKMAKTKKSQRKRPAGSHKKHNRAKRHVTKRRNPGTFGGPMDWLSLGGGALIGGIGATSLPQMILSGSNTGAVGYLAMAASTGILAVVAHMVSKRTMLTAGVIAGGAGALIRRVIQDYSPAGSYLNTLTAGSGMGDYLTNWQYTTPQIIGGPGNTTLGTAGTVPVSVAGAGQVGRALMNV